MRSTVRLPPGCFGRRVAILRGDRRLRSRRLGGKLKTRVGGKLKTRGTSGSLSAETDNHRWPLGPSAPRNLHHCLGFQPGSPFRWALGLPEPPRQHSQLRFPTVLPSAPSQPYGFPRGPRSRFPDSAVPAPRSNPDSTDAPACVKVTKAQVVDHRRRSEGGPTPTNPV
jgi:hypothetical protein